MQSNKPDSNQKTADGRQSADPARRAAFQVLQAVFEHQAYANLSSLQALSGPELSAQDRAFASAMIYGTISRVFSIDWLISQCSSREIKSLDQTVRTLLRMGVWQLYWSGSVPDSAAVNESVKLAHHLNKTSAAGYVNAVLRQISRERLALPDNKPPVLYSLPPELYGYLKKWYADEAPLLAKAFLDEKKTISVRVNRCRTSPEKLGIQLQEKGMNVLPGQYCEEALQLELSGRAVSQLDAWQQGLLTVQDEAAMLAVCAADPQPGQRVIDLCAAPGGKTAHLFEKAKGNIELLAFDKNQQRLDLMQKNLALLGHQGINCRLGDATGTGMDPALIGSADLVLLDAPCSGLGLLARKPELRLTMTHEKMIQLYPLQAAMLDYAASLVKPGGCLIYSTCTMNPAENLEAVNAFCQRSPFSFEKTSISALLPDKLLAHDDLRRQAADGWVQLLPHRHHVDGFFIARLRRNAQVSADMHGMNA